VEECQGDQKQLFSVIDQLLHQKQPPTLPSFSSAKELANAFSSFFVSKIQKIRTKIDQNLISRSTPAFVLEVQDPNELSSFTPASEQELLKVIKAMKNSTCNADPIPTVLMKQCITSLIATITKTVNLSLSSGTVPTYLKHAVVRPHLKKPDLDHECYLNYRPLSNLPFQAKILEKIVVKRLLDHMERNNLHEVMQSAYKQFHSTETALVRVHNDILMNMDNKQGTILVLLDLSAAFDTIDHPVLFKTLEHRLGIKGTALKWFKSYLSERTQAVLIENISSDPVSLKFGVPQGSVLGPLLYTIYTLPLGDILRNLEISYHLYADDTQLYLSFNFTEAESQQECLNKMQKCVSEVKAWMTENKLKLNDDKTEVMFIASDYYRKLITLENFSIDSTVIVPTSSVRNIGVIFDHALTMKNQVTTVCRSLHLHLRNIGSIRKCISHEACEKLIHALVTSRLDNGNATLYGLPDTQLGRLQRMLHIAARILTLTPVYNHITPILIELHWLPVSKRIEYKILLLTFKSLNGLAPQYLSDLLISRDSISQRNTRSSNTNLLEVPSSRTTTFGNRAFSRTAPALWKCLPVQLRTMTELVPFKKSLKTHLFKNAYH